jgi:hypothetical protein
MTLVRCPRVSVLVMAGVLSFAACTSNPAAQPAPSVGSTAPTRSTGSSAAAACPPSPLSTPSSSRLPEIEGVGQGVTLWALGPTPRRGQEVKIVWRMTGAGDLWIRAVGPGGTTLDPVWGPEPHYASTWHRPGDEWGTGWVFPITGCWIVQASRSEVGAGQLALRVVP